MRVGAVAVALFASAAAAHAISFEAAPLGHWDVSGWVEGYAVLRTDQSSQRQLPEGIIALQVTGDVHPKVRVFLDLRNTYGGPPEHATGFGLYNLRDTFQNISPTVEIAESYLDLFLPSLDVRLGRQKFTWGRLDAFQPTDIVSPRWYNDPFVIDREEQKIGIPALQASYYPPALGAGWPQDLRATLIWVPFPVPPRFPLPGERWYPPAYTLPSTTLVTPPPPAPGMPPVPDLLTNNTLTTANNPPPWRLDEGAVGLRLSGLWRGADWDLYYYNGLETAPAFAFTTTLTATDQTQFRQCAQMQVQGPCMLDADVVLHPINGRIQLGGGDVAFESHGFTFRMEGAFSANRFLPQSFTNLLSPASLANATSPVCGQMTGESCLEKVAAMLANGKSVLVNLGDLFVRRDIVQWGAGVDYHWEGWVPEVQLNQTFILNNDANLLISNYDTSLFLVLRRPLFGDRLQAEGAVLQGLVRSYTTGGVRFTYSITDHLRARVGYLFIAGTRNSIVGEFGPNDEGYIQLRYSF
jgi:hypothetical protein